MLSLAAPTRWYIIVGNLLNEIHIRVIKHDMEMLNSMHRFQ